MKMKLGELIGFLRAAMAPKELERLDREAQEIQARADVAFERKMAALKQAWDLCENGGDWRAAIRDRLEADLEHAIIQAKSSDGGMLYSHVSIMACGAGGRHCPACAALDGKTYTFEEASENPPLPPDGCTCEGFPGAEPGFCLCMYQPAFDDEL